MATLADAWAEERSENAFPGVTEADIEVAQHLFYAGAAAVIAMLSEAGPDKVAIYMTLHGLMEEIQAYVDAADGT